MTGAAEIIVNVIKDEDDLEEEEEATIEGPSDRPPPSRCEGKRCVTIAIVSYLSIYLFI